jgi:CspA family cold shock protein
MGFDPVSLSRRESRLGFIRSAVWPAVQSCAAAFCFLRDLKMSTGKVKWFNTQKGFGFIQPDGGSKDVFVHISAVERAGIRVLSEGQAVSFDVVQDRGKESAGNLKLI